jgi:hypothetical protein
MGYVELDAILRHTIPLHAVRVRAFAIGESHNFELGVLEGLHLDQVARAVAVLVSGIHVPDHDTLVAETDIVAVPEK